MQTYKLKKFLTDAQGELLKGKYLDGSEYDLLIDHDADGYDMNGNLLFRFRKQAIPLAITRLGYESFKNSIELSDGRGNAAGGYRNRPRKDGSISNTIAAANKVYSGNVGFMDAEGLTRYCRKTAFARNYFEKFTQGIPFVEAVDNLYRDLCPEHYARQLRMATATDVNYRIGNTSFTTVTVNKNFQTSVHKDSGDYPEGFGNLCVYREGVWTGAYFVLPEFRVAIDMQNEDILFVDVHRWHGNTPFIGENYLRIAFVMYYREYMYKCGNPTEQLSRVKKEHGGFFKL